MSGWHVDNKLAINANYPRYPYQNQENQTPNKRMKFADSESSDEADSTASTPPAQAGFPLAQSTPMQMQMQLASNYALPPMNQQQQQQFGYYGMQMQGFPAMPLQEFTYPTPYFDHSASSSNDDSGNVSMGKKPDNEIKFCEVPGRLSLLGSNKKVFVSLAEIRRRIGAPECLNQSILSAILRKAKNKDGGTKLNAQLREHNITLAQGRRKSAPNTSFTALCEQEATSLAYDFHAVSKKHFPYTSVCYEMLWEITDFNDYSNKRIMVNSIFNGVSDLVKLIHRDPSPTMSGELNRPSTFHPDSVRDFANFSLITHGFGIPGHAASWHTLLHVYKAMHEAMADPKGFCERIQRASPPWAQQMFVQPQPNQEPVYHGM